MLLGLVPMMIAIFLIQRTAAMGWGLAAGWVTYLAVLTPLMRPMWRQEVNT